MKNVIKALIMIVTVLFIFSLFALFLEKEAKATDFPEDPNETPAQCASIAPVSDISEVNYSDLCKVGSTGGIETKENGWEYGCYDSLGYLDDSCFIDKIVPEVIEEPVVEEKEEIVPEVVKVINEPLIVADPVIEPVVRDIPTPVISEPVVEAPKKKSKKNKSLTKGELVEKYCLISRDDLEWNYKKRSRNEIKTRCLAEVAVCPIRSQQ